MKLELQSASNFLIYMINRSSRSSLAQESLIKLQNSLMEVWRRRYRDHWFPEKPFRGSGYRCIRINSKMDPVIAQACIACDIDPAVIHSVFPFEFTMWIDPLEVTYRIGENGPICTLYEFKENDPNNPWPLQPSPSKY